MSDTELLALSYLPLDEALAALDDQKLQQELVRIYYPSQISLNYVIEIARADLIAVLFNLGFGVASIDTLESTEAVCKALSEYKTSLQEFRLINFINTNTISYIPILSALMQNNQITSLDFHDLPYEIDLNLFSDLISKNQLKSLDLSTNSKKYKYNLHQFLTSVANNTSLIKLDLSYVSINQADDINSCAQILRQNKTLKSFFLTFKEANRFVQLDKAFLYFGRALIDNTSLTELGLIDTWVYGSSAIKLIEGLTKNKSITRLDLENFQGWNGNFEFRAPIQDLIRTNQTLKSISFSQTSGALNFIIQSLTQNKTLQDLNFSGCNLFEDLTTLLIENYKNNHNLTSLDLSSNRISYPASLIEYVAENQVNLKNLNLNNNLDFNPLELCRALETNITLTSLSLEDVDLGMGAIRYLDTALLTNTTLTSLSLAYNKFSWEMIEMMAGSPTYTEGFLKNRTLTYLNLSYSQIGTKEAVRLIKLLVGNPIIFIDLAGNREINENELASINTLLNNRQTLIQD